jgi:hypothetical protein
MKTKEGNGIAKIPMLLLLPSLCFCLFSASLTDFSAPVSFPFLLLTRVQRKEKIGHLAPFASIPFPCTASFNVHLRFFCSPFVAVTA